MARMRTSLVALTATVAAFAAPTAASAATTSCDGLQDALDNPANSVVTLVDDAACHGHFTLPDRSLTLEGGPSSVNTLTGDGEDQILSGDNVGSTTIRGLTFTQGRAGEDDGGAIHIEGASPVTIDGNTFESNEADRHGGAVFLSLDNQTFQPARGDAAPVILRDNTFSGNTAEEEGGGAWIGSFFRDIVVDGNTFEDNEANRGDGGGLEVEAARNITLTDNSFDGNFSGEDGGGAAVNTCVARVTGNTFNGNSIEADDNEAGLDGGGLFISGNICQIVLRSRGGFETGLTQSGNLFAGNSINGAFSGDGGGEYVENLDTVSTGDRFVGNTIAEVEQARGGGLFASGFTSAPFAGRNLVAAGNKVTANVQQPPASRGTVTPQAFGGGVYLLGRSGGFRVEDSTIQGNQAPNGSGIAGLNLDQQGARGAQTDLALHNSIVFGNTGADTEIDGLSQRDVRSSDTCVDGNPHAGAGNRCIDPKLKTPDTDGNVDQQAGSSPTIDAGDSSLVDDDLTSDYAGDGRVLGTSVDIGADEFKPTETEPEPTPTPTPVATTPPPAQAVQGVQQRSCKSKRVFRIRIRVPHGKKARSAVVRVNGKKVKVVRGKRLRAPVRLRGLPKGKFKVRITIRLTNGKKISGVRTYHTCIPKLPGDGPPKV